MLVDSKHNECCIKAAGTGAASAAMAVPLFLKIKKTQIKLN